MSINPIGLWPAKLLDAVRLVEKALKNHKHLKQVDGDINLKLVDDREITRLNKEYNGNAYATDVLTFAYHEDHPDSPTIADIAICQPIAERQAEAAKTGIRDEVGLLALHGILHALGYDHQDSKGTKTMQQLQSDIMDAAGLEYREFAWHQ